MAKSRFLSIEQKLQRDKLLRLEHVKFMNDCLEMGHIEEIVNKIDVPEDVYYLPHHAVIKTASITTKVRVVFNASARGTKEKSLRHTVKWAGCTKGNIFDINILCRLRKLQYVLMADVEKMYR